MLLTTTSPDHPMGLVGSSKPSMILLALFVTTIISYLDRYILALLASPLKMDLHLSDTQIGLLQGLAFTLFYALASVPAGYFSDRISRKRILIFGILCWSLGTSFCGLTSSFSELFVARMVVGFGEATLGPAAISLITSTFAPSQRGRAIGFYQLGGCVGGGASLLVGGLLLAAMHDASAVDLPVLGVTATWRLVFAVFGLVGIVWAPVVALIREPEQQRRAPVQATATHRQPGNRGTVIAIYAAYAVSSFLNSGLVAWAPTMYIREFGQTTSQTGIFAGLLTTVAVSIGCLLSGVWGDRSTKRRAFAGKLRVTIFAFIIAVPGVIIFATAGGLLSSAVGLGLSLFAGGLMLAGAPAVLADILPRERQGLGMSFYFFNVAFFGLTLGPLAGGLVNDSFFAGADLRSAILCTYAVAALAGSILVLLIARPYHRLLVATGAPVAHRPGLVT